MWSHIYQPTGSYNLVMESLLDKITLDEWMDVLKDVNTKSALGPSGINYNLIKAFPSQVHEILIDFINLTLELGQVPTQWKCSTIHPIPKPQVFQYEISNT